MSASHFTRNGDIPLSFEIQIRRPKLKNGEIRKNLQVDHQGKIGYLVEWKARLLRRKFLNYVFNIGQGEGEENEDEDEGEVEDEDVDEYGYEDQGNKNHVVCS